VAGHVVRVREAYPVYDAEFPSRVEAIRRGLAPIENLQVLGRNGMHRYNNMDHSMLTGLLAARNVLGARHDLWAVNAEEAYLEAS
jgi:protoporphyrinogen oxidase